MSIMITAIRGCLGSALARSFFQEGDTVFGTSSKEEGRTDVLPSEIKIARLALGDPVSSRIFEEIDYVIHCAHDFSLVRSNKTSKGQEESLRRLNPLEFVSRLLFLPT